MSLVNNLTNRKRGGGGGVHVNMAMAVKVWLLSSVVRTNLILRLVLLNYLLYGTN